MRFVGAGHQFHRESGLCRRCELSIDSEEAKAACSRAPKHPHTMSSRAPNPFNSSMKLYADSLKQTK